MTTMLRPIARGAEYGRAFALLRAQIGEELRDGKAEGDQRKRRSYPGDLRSLVSEQRALTGETHARIGIIYRNPIRLLVRHGSMT